MRSFQRGKTPQQFSSLLESIQKNTNKLKERSKDTHLRKEIIKEEIVELDQPIIEAIHETKPFDYEDRIDKLNNTIDNLKSSINAHRFNQLPAIQSKEYHEGIKRTVSDTAKTSFVEDNLQENLLYIPTTSLRKQTRIYYNFNSKLKAYEDLFDEYPYAKPSTLFNYYAEKIKNEELTTDIVKKELEDIIELTRKNPQKHGGQKKGAPEDKLTKFNGKIKYLRQYRKTLRTMQREINNISFSGTGLYVNYYQMIGKLHILLEHKKGGNDSDLLKNEGSDINDLLLKNNIISKAQHKKIYAKIF